jgi:uncharacterized protein (TIGR02145 family)
MKNRFFLLSVAILFFAFSSTGQETGMFTDSRDGKVYKTVKIGTQTWMAENLAYTISGGCFPYNYDSINVKKYGLLYYWDYAKDACPEGWHIPTLEEWATLSKYLDGNEELSRNIRNKIPARKMVTVDSLQIEATNSSGFSALLGGFGFVKRNRFSLIEDDGLTKTYKSYGDDYFVGKGTWDTFWSLRRNGKKTIVWLTDSSFAYANRNSNFLCSVRCVKD